MSSDDSGSTTASGDDSSTPVITAMPVTVGEPLRVAYPTHPIGCGAKIQWDTGKDVEIIIEASEDSKS